ENAANRSSPQMTADPSRLSFARPAFRSRSRHRDRWGFSLLELMIVIAIIVILALIALPGVPDKLIRDRITEAIKLADIVNAPMATAWGTAGQLPGRNVDARTPVA